MSGIDKKSIAITEGVTITVGKDNVITVKGKKGELKQAIDRDITVEVKDGHVSFGRPTDQSTAVPPETDAAVAAPSPLIDQPA